MPQRRNSKTSVDTAVRELPRWSRYPNSLQMESTNSFMTVYSCVIFSSSEVKKLISLEQSQTLYRIGSRKMVQDSVGFVLMIKLTKINKPICPIIDIAVRYFHYNDTCVPRPPKSKNIKSNPQKSLIPNPPSKIPNPRNLEWFNKSPLSFNEDSIFAPSSSFTFQFQSVNESFGVPHLIRIPWPAPLLFE